MTTDISTQLTKAQNELAMSNARNKKLEEKLAISEAKNRKSIKKFSGLKAMVSMYSAIDKNVSKDLIAYIEEEVS
ncbi:MAG TPA: hypothetical protein VK094_00125 [Pseudogracilibacillus sp.]|nr:hypothetical protein [Pseudogracilibacillus sp.]